MILTKGHIYDACVDVIKATQAAMKADDDLERIRRSGAGDASGAEEAQAVAKEVLTAIRNDPAVPQ